MTDDQIKYMVDRFLGWRLPENFAPDAGISFERIYNEHTPWPMKHEPVGTNLFDASQAEQMVRYMVDGIPAPEPMGLREAAEMTACEVRAYLHDHPQGEEQLLGVDYTPLGQVIAQAFAGFAPVMADAEAAALQVAIDAADEINGRYGGFAVSEAEMIGIIKSHIVRMHSPAPGMVPFLRNFTMADDVPGGYDKDGQYAWKAGWNACADYVTGKRELPHLIHDILLKASRE